MILFCEDCGQQNELEPAAFAGGKAVFKCCACGYHNAYKITAPYKIPSGDEQMPFFFKNIRAVSGIIGAFFYHIKKGVIGNDMPSILASRDVEKLGAGLSQGYWAGYNTFSDISEMTVVISDKYFFVFKVGVQLYAVVVSAEPDLPGKVRELINGCSIRA